MQNLRMAFLLLVAASTFAASCSKPDISLIQAKLDDGDEHIKVIQQAAVRREYWTMFENYETLRSNYIEVASQVKDHAISDSTLEAILARLGHWEDFIERFRAGKRKFDETPNPLGGVVSDRRSSDEELLKQFEPSAEEKERRDREWNASESRLDAAIADIEKIRTSRESKRR